MNDCRFYLYPHTHRHTPCQFRVHRSLFHLHATVYFRIDRSVSSFLVCLWSLLNVPGPGVSNMLVNWLSIDCPFWKSFRKQVMVFIYSKYNFLFILVTRWLWRKCLHLFLLIVTFEHLQTKMNPYHAYTYHTSQRTVFTIQRLVNLAEGNNGCLLQNWYGTQPYTVWTKCRFFNAKPAR